MTVYSRHRRDIGGQGFQQEDVIIIEFGAIRPINCLTPQEISSNLCLVFTATEMSVAGTSVLRKNIAVYSSDYGARPLVYLLHCT